MPRCAWEVLEYPGCLRSCAFGWRELRAMLGRRGPAKVGGRVLLIPAYGGRGLPRTSDAAIVERVRRAHEGGAIVASACAGAAWIAAAGIDRGRSLTTHWNLAAELAALRPDLRVTASELVIDHGDLVSAGGMLSWVDLGLHLAERFWGAATADEVARVLVWDRNRGSQLPFAPPGGAWIPLRPDPALDRALAWARGRYKGAMGLEEWAAAAALGVRTMERRWVAAFGEPPLRWLQAVRVEEALRLLERGEGSWEAITASCGYSDPASFRELFERRVRRTPSACRGPGARRGGLRGAALPARRRG